MVSIAIRSYYIDYYDHAFESNYFAEAVWNRVSNVPPYKRESFELLRSKGFPTPAFGTKMELIHRGLNKDTKVVAYYDPKGHCTHGKYLTTLGEVWYDNMECSVYIETQRPEHTRVVHIGNRHAAYRMWSNDEWRSNTGTEIDMKRVFTYSSHRGFDYPLFAVDYVAGIAVDLNFCPGLGKTPIQDAFSPDEVYRLVQEWVNEKGLNTFVSYERRKK